MSAVPNVALDPLLVAYRDRKPSALQRRTEKIDGSEMELQIVSALKRAGVLDEDVFAYFDHYELPRYMEEGRSRSWLQSLIDTAVASNSSFVSKSGSDEQDQQQHTRVIGSEHNLPKQTRADGVLVHLVLRRRAHQEADGDVPILTGWRQEIIEISAGLATKPISLSTARRMTEDLIEQGYVRLEALNHKSKLVYLTEKGLRAAEPARGKWGRFINLHPRSEEGNRSDAPVVIEFAGVGADNGVREEADPSEAVKARPRRTASPEKKRVQRIKMLRKDRQINGYYRLRFKGNKIRYIQLLTSPDGWAARKVWQQLPVGYDDAGLPLYLTVLAEETGEDRIAKLLPSRWSAREQCFAAAVELERTDTGFRVLEYVDEDGELRPSVGVIVQSEANFFTKLSRPRLVGKIVSVRGTDAGKKRRYSFTPEGEALAINHSYDLGPLLDNIASKGTRDRILGLPPGWFHMPAKRKELVLRLLADSNDPRSLAALQSE